MRKPQFTQVKQCPFPFLARGGSMVAATLAKKRSEDGESRETRDKKPAEKPRVEQDERQTAQ